jgi:hypothetical protein
MMTLWLTAFWVVGADSKNGAIWEACVRGPVKPALGLMGW